MMDAGLLYDLRQMLEDYGEPDVFEALRAVMERRLSPTAPDDTAEILEHLSAAYDVVKPQ